MWGAWSLLQQRYRNLRCVSSVHLLLRLYQVCVPPAGSYGCEVWGIRRLSGAAQKARQRLASVHLQILRQISGIRTDVPTAILFRENCRKSPYRIFGYFDQFDSGTILLAYHLQAYIGKLHWTIAGMLLCTTQRTGLGVYTRPCKSLGIPWILLATIWIRYLWPRLDNSYRVN